MSFGNLRSTRRGAISAFLALIAVAATLTAQTGVFARLQASLNDPSPARGHASVIAQGVAEMPFDPIAWRVVADTAEPLESAQAVERALGFVVTTTGGVNLADETAGFQQRLAPGEAAFVAEGSIQIRASLTDQNTPYLRVGLVDADDAQNPGSDELVFGGEPFTAPEGRRDIDLVRDVLKAGERSTLPASEFPVLVIATSGTITVDDGKHEAVTLTASTAAEFSGELTITTSGDASYVAGVIGPEVPEPPRTTGSITIGVYLCAPGVTPADLGDPIDSSVASDCDTITGGVDTTLTLPDGDTLTFADATNEEGGLFAWTDLPFGDYTVGSPTDLPAGATDPTFVDDDGNVASDGALTIDSATPDAHLDLYLFQSATTGSITVTVYNCPNGVDVAAANPTSCEAASATGLTLTAPDGSTFGLADATADGGSYVWSGLGVSTATSNAGNYGLVEQIPDGYASVAADGATAGDEHGAFSVTLSADAPNALVNLYNLVQATGTITVDTIVCPDGADNPATCSREFGPTGLTGVFIQDAAGENGPLTEGNALVEGDGPYVWANVPLGDYTMDTSGLVPPAGYTIEAVVLTPNGADASGGFSLSTNLPIANVVVFLKPIENGGGDGTPTASDLDADGDGLSDAAEATPGTDPNNPDSDGDCYTDGAEIAAGANPLDATSHPTGDCDVAS